MRPVIDPPAARLDELAGTDGRGVSDDGDQVTLAARLHPQDAEAAVLVVESHPLDQAGELLAGEAGVGAEQDPYLGPAPADAGDEARHLVLGAGRDVDVRAPQFCRQQLTAAEHIERQITVTVIIAVEEPAFLVAVQGVASRSSTLSRGALPCASRNTSTNTSCSLAIAADLVIAGASVAGGMFQPVRRALARQRRTILALGLEAVAEQRQHRIEA